jgi:hypothetical protein
MKKVEQIDIMAKAFIASFAVVSMGFLAYLLIKAPAIGVVKVTVVLLNGLKLAVFGLAGVFWLLLNIEKPETKN